MSIRSLLSFGLLTASLATALPAADHAKPSPCSTSSSTSQSHSTSVSSTHSSTHTSTHTSSVATSSSVTVKTTTTSSSSTATQSTTLLATATGSKGLDDYARKAGKLYFGTAADIPGTNETTDKYYRAELANRDDWGQVTPANAMKVSLALFILSWRLKILMGYTSGFSPNLNKGFLITQKQINFFRLLLLFQATDALGVIIWCGTSNWLTG